ncbi:MAG: aspartyl/glutamyl-tRNA amidotransferase subunit B [Candidatus Altiarchaeales archaeon WOR_SM1_79]|nr:MAG: aspartyl/glutamyl-tRNA amidotransferase subunit B [Candidatus Altiarchaeales archaeon WOR_SM1_79]
MPIDYLKYQPIIGLEVHAQLLTQSKIFCNCSTKFGAKENTQVCPICLGMPGVLPVLNRKAVEFAIKMGLATQCQISSHSVFARKNYFYPDLPKGYQISQYDAPLCYDGYIEIDIDNEIKKVGIVRIHLEEDAGKSIHAEAWVKKDETLVDLNRCGVPLIEIVSKPDIRSPREAYCYLSILRQLLLYLEICDGNMEEGSLRCDANVSVRPIGSKEFGVKTELKNMNSFHAIEKALTYEIDRQIQIIENAGTVQQETLFWDTNKNMAMPMRSKEESHDYRYFPEPDLVMVNVNQSWVDKISAQMPELPLQRRNRFIYQYNIPKYDAHVLTENKAIADYYEQIVRSVSNPKLASNWVMGEILREMKEQKEPGKFPIPSIALAELLNLIIDGTISGIIAKTIFNEMVTQGKSATTILKEKKLTQISDKDWLKDIISKVIDNNLEEVARYKAGKIKLFSYFMGQVMRVTQGKANPHLVTELLQEKLSSF